MSARLYFGGLPWWHYPAGFFAVAGVLLVGRAAVERIYEVDAFDMGALKLLAACAGGLGIQRGLTVTVFSAGLAALLLFVARPFGVCRVPSSPLILTSVLATYAAAHLLR